MPWGAWHSVGACLLALVLAPEVEQRSLDLQLADPRIYQGGGHILLIEHSNEKAVHAQVGVALLLAQLVGLLQRVQEVAAGMGLLCSSIICNCQGSLCTAMMPTALRAGSDGCSFAAATT